MFNALNSVVKEMVMKKIEKDRANPQAAATEPRVLPDVATEPHPSSSPVGCTHEDAPKVGGEVLKEALPEITAAARKVGGFKRLAEIASQLEDTGTSED
jgi:hypothetical protein